MRSRYSEVQRRLGGRAKARGRRASAGESAQRVWRCAWERKGASPHRNRNRNRDPNPDPNPNPSPNQAAVLEAQRISELDALLPHLERINQWDVDVFALWEASENMGLVVGTYHLLEQHNLVSKFRLSKPRLMTFLAKMQEGYR